MNQEMAMFCGRLFHSLIVEGKKEWRELTLAVYFSISYLKTLRGVVPLVDVIIGIAGNDGTVRRLLVIL